ncbi:MAG: hypothetical protein KAJ46_04640 [Sedimentisphaerales bacterium]|nr:hypothetical protein [Sedimentisphaerales bacterium]
MATGTAIPGYVGASYVYDTNTNGENVFHFYLSTAGTYYVHARTYYDNEDRNSFYVSIDDTWVNPETGPAIWGTTYGSWHFDTATSIVNQAGVKTWSLTAGWHFLEVHSREANARLDRLVITTDSNPPVDPGGAESSSSGLYTYSFGGGDLSGSVSGTDNIIVANSTNGADETSNLSAALTVTFDNGTAASAVPDLDIGSDTGDSSTDNLTNDTTATFTGAAGSVEDGSTVYLRVDTDDKRSTTANADGSYSVTLLVGDLAEGTNAVDIYYIDVAGNTSADSADLTVTLDTTDNAPGAAPDLDAGSDSGSSNSDNLTNDTTATFTGGAGSVEADSTVWLRVAAANTRSATAAGDGSYSITLIADDLAEGANVVDIIYIDEAGNTSADSANLTVTLDTTANAPGAASDLDAGSDTGSSNSDNITSDTTTTFSGIAGIVEDDSTVWLRVGGVNTRSATAAGDGSYSVTLLANDLSEGGNTVDIIYIDEAGNTSPDSANLTVTLDTKLATPAATDLRSASDTGDNADNITSDNAAWFDGYAERGATVQIFVGAGGKGTDTADAATGVWSIQLDNGDLAAGANDITITATDTAGNSQSSAALVVTYDAAGTVPNAPKLAAASDTGSSNTDGITNIEAATIYGSVAGGNTVEAGATVHVRTNKNAAGWVEVGTTVGDGNGNWSYTFDGVDDLAGGTNLVEVYIVDIANNTSGNSADLTITLDLTANAPAAAPDLDVGSDTGSSNSDNITNDTTPTFTGGIGSVEADTTVWLRIDGSNVRNTTAAGDGSYSVTLLGGDITAGTRVVDIIYIDSAGNTTSDSPNLSVTLDTSAAAPASAPDLDAGSDTGDSSTDNLTDDTTATFTGPANSVEGSSTVWLRVGTVNKRSTTANADGSYSVTLQAGDLAEGANAVDIYYIDPAGNTSADSADLAVTLDTAAGAPVAAPDLDAGSDSGSSNSDNITNDTTATFSGIAGTVTGNSTVWLRVGTVNKHGTTANANGSYSVTLQTGDLAEGANAVDIYYIDPAGNTSADSADLTVTLDTTANAPAAAPDLDAGSDSGSSNSDNTTNDTTATFSGIAGTVEDNSTVWLRVAGVNTRSTTAAGDGSYSVTLLAGDLTEGANTVDIIYIDPAGNTSADSADLTVTLDTTANAPATACNLDGGSDTGSSSTDNLTYDSTATFTGPANSVEGDATVWLRVGAVNKRSTTANSDGSWSVTLQAGDLIEGANAVDFYYIDPAGNTSTDSADLTVTLDTAIANPAEPDLAATSDTGTSDTDDITSETRPTIQGGAGTVEGLSTVHIWLDTPGAPDTEAGTATAAANGSWNYTFTSASPLEEGVNLIHIVAVDPAGNTSNDSTDLSVTINFDTGAEAPPDLEAVSDTGSANNDNITSDSTPTISGTCPNGATIKIRTNGGNIAEFVDNDGTDEDAAAGQWTYTFPGAVLNEGNNTVDFLTIDTDNNTTDWSIDLLITLDTSIEQPTLPDLATADDSGSSSDDNITNVDTPTLSGTAEAGSEITIHVNAHTDTTTTTASGIWTYNIANNTWLTEVGPNTIYATAEDTAGNSDDSINLTITLDKTVNAPAAADLTAATDTGVNNDDITSHANPRIVGTADADTQIDVRVGSVVVGTTTADGSGDWNYTFSDGQLNDGANVIDIISTDTAGNNAESPLPDLTITIEKIISIPGDPDLEAASDLGDDNTDNITSLATPTISGGVDANCTVYVRVNGTEVGNTAANGLGNWSYTFGPGELTEGTNIIDAWAEDAVGNVSDYSGDLNVTLDTTVATCGLPSLESTSDSGNSNSDLYTNDTTAEISGYCETGATVTINLDGADINTVTDGADGDIDGHWSYSFAGLAATSTGTDHEIKVSQTDVAGNTSAAYSTILTITVDDSVAPPGNLDLVAISDSGDLDDDNLTNIENITITGNVETNSSLELYLNTVLIDTISEDLISSATFTHTFSSGQLTEGSNQITAVATDKAGNVSAASTALTVTLDKTISQPGLPDLANESDTGENNDDEVTSDETPTFTGLADPNTHVTIRVNGEPINTVDADAGGSWSYTFVQGEIQTGVQIVDVATTDTAGNQSQPSEDLTIWLNVAPTQPASPNLQSDSDSGSINTDNLTNIGECVIDGKADADRTVEIYIDSVPEDTTPADSNGFWQYTFASGNLAEGDNEITIITEDSSGLRSSASYPLTITLDITAPTAPLPDLQPSSDTGMSDTDDLTSDQTSTIAGTTEPSALIDLYHNEGYVTRLTATSGGGNWSYTFAPGIMIEGENEIYIVVTDVAGNVSQPSETLTVILDIQQDDPDVPTVTPDTDTGSSETDGLTNNSTCDIFGTVKADSSVEILVSGQTVGAVAADEEGNWQYAFESGDLDEGMNAIEVVSTDPVGNVARSPILELTLDTTPPVIYNYFPLGTHTQTTQTIELYIHGNDLDSLSAGDTSGYLLYGSGGDGTFDDGNEWTIPISGVTVETITGLVQLNTSVVLSDDTYQLIIDPEVSLHDEAGNPAQLNLSAAYDPDGLFLFDEQSQIVFTFAIDTAGPPAPQSPQIDPDYDSGIDDSDNITNITAPLISVSAEPEVSVEIICNGVSAGFASETEPGLYRLFLDSTLIREGENLLLARAFDSLGNSSELSEITTVVYDSEGPLAAAIVVDELWYDEGPTQISIVLNEANIDPDSVLNDNNYLLLAAGGDGTYDDGNETVITLSEVSYSASTQSIILTMPQTVTGVSELGPDDYKLAVLNESSIADAAGNVLEQGADQEFLVVQTEIIYANESYRFGTEDGKTVTVVLSGTGQARILTGESAGLENTIEQIVLRETTESSTLFVSAAGGTSPFTIGRILSDTPMRMVMANQAIITEQISFQQELDYLFVSDIDDGTQISIAADADTDEASGLRIYAGEIGDNVDIEIDGHLCCLRAESFDGGSLTAHSAGRVDITTGDLAGQVQVTNGDLNGLAVYQGDLTGNLTVAGQIGFLQAFRGTIAADVSAGSIDYIYSNQLDQATIRVDGRIGTVFAQNGDNVSISSADRIERVLFSRSLSNSIVSAGGDLEFIFIGSDAIDNLILSGADLGADGQLDGVADSFGDGDIGLLLVGGRYSGTTAAAAVNPGADLTFFTEDDTSGHTGNISRVIFGWNSLADTTGTNTFGLLASGTINPFFANGQILESPYQLDLFRLLTIL